MTTVTAFEPAPCRFDAHLQHALRRRRSDLARKHALEMPDAHRHALREIVDGEAAIEMLRDPDLQLAN